MSYTKTVDKQAHNIHYAGNWNGLEGGSGVELETATDVNVYYASGAFGGGRPLSNKLGVGARNLTSGIDFIYGKRLDASLTEDPTNGFGTQTGGLVDTGSAGSMSSGKAIRIVEDSKNVKDISGMGLQVYAQNLLTNPHPPIEGACYVDPVLGRFALPRPAYWSRVDSFDSIANPVIQSETPAYSVYGTVTGSSFAAGVRFGNCYYREDSYSIGPFAYFQLNGGLQIYPRGTAPLSCQRGTMECWANMYHAMSTFAFAESWADTNLTLISIPNVIEVRAELRSYVGFGSYDIRRVYIVVNDVEVASNWVITDSVTYHFYVVWDAAGGLTGGKTVRVFVNNSEAVSTTVTPTGLTSFVPMISINTLARGSTALGNSGASSVGYLDNVKMWNEVVSEDPSWSYNSGSGREDAMHAKYDVANGYKPRLTSVSDGLGYYYIATSETPAALPEFSADKTVTLEPANDIRNAYGRFSEAGGLYDDTFVALVNDTQFQYDKRMDAALSEDVTNGFGTTVGGIIDSSASGALGSGQYLRVVENSKNVKDPSGLNLQVFAKRLNVLVSPPATRCYIDPMLGLLLLPRPVYWSKCSNASEITTPEIGYPGYAALYTNDAPSYITGKFGNCTGILNSLWNTTKTAAILPFGALASGLLAEGTASFWVNHTFGGLGWSQSKFNFGTNCYVQIDAGAGTAELFMSNISLGTYSTTFTNQWKHIYIVWQTSGGLSGGKTVRVFINGIERLSGVSTFSPTGSLGWEASCRIPAWYENGAWVDNIKIWNHVASQDPSFEYNSGTGREDALHAIYSSSNGYKPVLGGASSGVGYYQLGTAGRNVIINV